MAPRSYKRGKKLSANLRVRKQRQQSKCEKGPWGKKKLSLALVTPTKTGDPGAKRKTQEKKPRAPRIESVSKRRKTTKSEQAKKRAQKAKGKKGHTELTGTRGGSRGTELCEWGKHQPERKKERTTTTV